MERLIKNEILPDLDFMDLNICVDCIKEKQTKYTKKEATRSTQLLEIVHTDICGPFDVNFFGKERYFITFSILMTIHVRVMSTYYMRNLRQWMP